MTRSGWVSSVALGLCLWCSFAGSASAATNLFFNPGCEQGLPTLDGTYKTSNSATVGLESAVVYDGIRSGSVALVSSAASFFTSTGYPLLAGHTYFMSCLFQSPNGASVGIDCSSASTDILSATTASSGWVVEQFTATPVVPSVFAIRVTSGASGYSVYFDDLQCLDLTGISIPSEGPSYLSAPAPQFNVVDSGDGNFNTSFGGVVEPSPRSGDSIHIAEVDAVGTPTYQATTIPLQNYGEVVIQKSASAAVMDFSLVGASPAPYDLARVPINVSIRIMGVAAPQAEAVLRPLFVLTSWSTAMVVLLFGLFLFNRAAGVLFNG